MLNTERVVPVVTFLRGGAVPDRLELGGDRHTYLSFRYLACHLPRLDWQQYRDSQNLTARLNLPNMHYAPAQWIDVYAHAMRGLFELEPDPEKQIKYIDFIDIYTALAPDELERYCEQYSEDVKKMSSFAERHLEKGRQEGMQQGEARVLLRQMERKFGAVSVEIRQRINQADEERLLEWLERILTANSPEEVLH
jgi:cob(I)alamin adenosyltransferase